MNRGILRGVHRRNVRAASRGASLLLCGLFLALACAPAPATAARADTSDFTFESFHADYTLSRSDDGHSTVTTVETLVAIFPDFDQNRGIIRALPLTDEHTPLDVTVLSVADAEANPVPFTSTENEDFLELALGTDDYVHGRTTYVITYTMRDAVRGFERAPGEAPGGPSDGDPTEEFYWDVNGVGWQQPFGSVSVTLRVDPALEQTLTGESACYRGSMGQTERCEIIRTTDAAGGTFAATSANLGPTQTMTIAVGFEPGTFTLPARASDNPIVKVLPWVVLAVTAGLILSIVILRLTLWRDARGRGIVIARYTAPEGLHPLLAGELLGRSRYKRQAMPAQLLNFAVLGAARLREKPNGNDVRYSLEIVDAERLPEGPERAALTALCGSEATGTMFELNPRSFTVGDRMKALTAALPCLLRDEGYRTSVVSPLHSIWQGMAFLALIGAGLILVWAYFMAAMSMLVIVMVLLAWLGYVLVKRLIVVPPRLTVRGAETIEYRQGLQLYIRLAEADRLRMLQSPEGAERLSVAGLGNPADPLVIVKVYERLLPWAVLWGLEEQWTTELAAHYATTAVESEWMQGAPAELSMQLIRMSSALRPNRFVSTPAPRSEPSWSDSGGRGRSSFGGSSGGGFAGGGGGGGGGGGR